MPKITKQSLINLQKSLVTDEAIGKKFGVTRQWIHHLLRKYGIESRYITNPKRNTAILAAFKKGTTGTDLAKKFKLSVSQTYRIIIEAGRKQINKGRHFGRLSTMALEG